MSTLNLGALPTSSRSKPNMKNQNPLSMYSESVISVFVFNCSNGNRLGAGFKTVGITFYSIPIIIRQ